MKKAKPSAAEKLLVHATGTGVLGPKDVAARASEIAEIENHARPTVTDRRRARGELAGRTVPPTSEVESRRTRTVSRDPSEPPGDRGQQKPEMPAPDEQMAAERLVLEGVEEAEHEQMLAARRRKSS
ncbi:MAG TPA: hypothetical protein VG838_18455 [Opitutaceae bacterium]|nr:hypothetical protein [Opitutaceae bacterium]